MRRCVYAMLLLLSCSRQEAKNRVQKSADKLGKMVVPIRAGDQFTSGTGVMVQLPSFDTGLLTNSHVCRGIASRNLEPFTIVEGRIIGPLKIAKESAVPDLCLFKALQFVNFLSLKVKNIDSLPFAAHLTVFGYPLNGPFNVSQGYFLSQRIVSIANPYTLDGECHGEVVTDGATNYCLIRQTLDAMTNPIFGGNSGSPVFDDQDELVGIVNSADNLSSQGFFIPGNQVEEFLKGQ